MNSAAARNGLKAGDQDAADAIWLHAAHELGISVVRSADAYASWDGSGTLTLASAEYLDADDCLAQMIFHELCHLLVSGEQARHQPDWGLDNTSPKDLVYEYATNRLQAALAQGYGLRTFMAVTTMWRPYYDALPRDPLAAGGDAAIPLARAGMQRARHEPYRAVLHAALCATATLADILRPSAAPDELWALTHGEHPAGFRLHHDTARRCSDCAWAVPRRGKIECRQTRPGCKPASCRLDDDNRVTGVAVSGKGAAVRLAPMQQGCEYHEPKLVQSDCFTCGACCHRGFDVVELRPAERFAKRHPELIEVRSTGRCVVPRPGGSCVALSGNGCVDEPYLCKHYEDRPRSCREFELNGDACLIARRRAGIS
ncbi:MAG TPA: YkgJ family cysteine cluster protein [Pseudomonadales bacterium]